MAENAVEQVERMNRLISEATVHYENHEYSDALHKVKTARILWDTRPSEWEKDGCRFSLRTIEGLIDMIEKDQQASAGGGEYYRVPVTHGRTTRPPYSDGYDC